MQSKRLAIYHSKRQMLVELSKKKELQKINNIVLKEMKELRNLFNQYQHDCFDPKTIEVLGDDPLLKAKKLIQLISKGEKGFIEKECREKLIQIHCDNKIFPKIINFLKIEKNEFQLCYNIELSEKLALFDLSKVKFNETYQKLQNVSDQTLILVHLMCIQHQIKKQQNFTLLYNTEQDHQIIKQLKDEAEKQTINQERNSQQIKAILIELYQQSIQERKQYKPLFKKSLYLVFNVLLQILLDENLVYPEFLKVLRITKVHKSQREYELQFQIIFKPNIQLINQIISIEKIQKQVDLLQLDQNTFNQQLPIYDKLYSLVQTHYPRLLLINKDDVIINYLQNLMINFRIHQKYLQQIFQEHKFKQFIEEINILCGNQIQEIQKYNSVESESIYEEYGTNLLKIGTYLFKLEKLIMNQNQINFQIKDEKQQSHIQVKFHQFLESELNRSRPFPMMLMFVSVIENQYFLNEKLLNSKELFDNSRFQRYISLRTLEKDKPNKMSENDVIVAQIQLIYEQREMLRGELSLLKTNENFNLLFKELEIQNPKSKTLLTKLISFIICEIKF